MYLLHEHNAATNHQHLQGKACAPDTLGLAVEGTGQQVLAELGAADRARGVFLPWEALGNFLNWPGPAQERGRDAKPRITRLTLYAHTRGISFKLEHPKRGFTRALRCNMICPISA